MAIPEPDKRIAVRRTEDEHDDVESLQAHELPPPDPQVAHLERDGARQRNRSAPGSTVGESLPQLTGDILPQVREFDLRWFVERFHNENKQLSEELRRTHVDCKELQEKVFRHTGERDRACHERDKAALELTRLTRKHENLSEKARALEEEIARMANVLDRVGDSIETWGFFSPLVSFLAFVAAGCVSFGANYITGGDKIVRGCFLLGVGLLIFVMSWLIGNKLQSLAVKKVKKT
jgi:hypothetical protein